MFDFIKDDSFEIQKTKDYILSIQVNLDGFSFLIAHPDEKRIVAFNSTPVKISSANLLARRLKEWLETEELLKSQFKSVRSFIFTENFTLVPEEYSGREGHRNLTSVLFDKKVHNHFIENKIEEINANLIFPVSQDIIGVLHHFFNKNIEISHPITNLLSYSFESQRRNKSVILSTKKYFYLIITRNNKLLLANSFSIAHQNDLVYNVINTFQQMEIARSETDLCFAGSIKQNAEIEVLLQPFFNNICNLKTDGIIANPEIIDNSLQLYLTII
jgi:hypothetical protein